MFCSKTLFWMTNQEHEEGEYKNIRNFLVLTVYDSFLICRINFVSVMLIQNVLFSTVSLFWQKHHKAFSWFCCDITDCACFSPGERRKSHIAKLRISLALTVRKKHRGWKKECFCLWSNNEFSSCEVNVYLLSCVSLLA